METRTLSLECRSTSETSRIGQSLGKLLFPGAIIALVGPLGAGKTLFSRGIAEGLELPTPSQVTSPTFVLIQEYAARLPIYHFDVYRLKQMSEFEDLGALEYFAGDGVCLVEWADRIEPLLPTEHLRVEFTLTGPESRTLAIIGKGSCYFDLVESLSRNVSNEVRGNA